jgi:hypothetical protein
MNGTVNIVEEMGLVVAKAAAKLNISIYYMYGHQVEVTSRLQQLTESPVHKDKKFPLVVLFTDIFVNRSLTGFYGTAKLQMVVANLTSPDYTAPQRLESNFKPVLQPIKDELIRQIQRHPQFTFYRR